VILGTVRDGTGRPVSLAHVFGIDSVGAFAVNVGTMTDSSGRYLLRLTTRVPYLGTRRIGFSPERARPLDWKAGDTLNVDLVLSAMPFELPTVHVGSNVCLRLDSLASENDVRRLWEGAVATIAAREALLNSYRFTEHATHQDLVRLDSVRVYDTTYFRMPPRDPLAKDMLSLPLATYQTSPLRRARPTIKLRSPGDRLLMHPQFFQRFCFDDRVSAAGDSLVEVHFRERGRGKEEVEVSGTMSFRTGIPGPARVTWEYFIKGKRMARSEQAFDLVNISGTLFPLVTLQSLTLLNPESGAVIGEGNVKMRYTAFALTPKR
jgi:hypothetical protein